MKTDERGGTLLGLLIVASAAVVAEGAGAIPFWAFVLLIGVVSWFAIRTMAR